MQIHEISNFKCHFEPRQRSACCDNLGIQLIATDVTITALAGIESGNNGKEVVRYCKGWRKFKTGLSSTRVRVDSSIDEEEVGRDWMKNVFYLHIHYTYADVQCVSQLV